MLFLSLISVSAKEKTTQLLAKYETFIDSSEYYLKLNPDKSLSFAVAALEISRNLKDEKKLAESYLQIGIIYRLNGNLSKSEFHLNKALSFGKNFNFYPLIICYQNYT